VNLKLEKNKTLEVKAGDILIFRNPHTTNFTHFLIVECKPKGQFTLLNMDTNCLMNSVTTYHVSEIVSDATLRFPQLKFDGVISSSEYEVRYVEIN
jgi:hypothetical protein